MEMDLTVFNTVPYAENIGLRYKKKTMKMASEKPVKLKF